MISIAPAKLQENRAEKEILMRQNNLTKYDHNGKIGTIQKPHLPLLLRSAYENTDL